MTLHVCKHSNLLCSVIFVNFYNFFNTDVIMSSVVRTGNCKLGYDCRRVCSRRNSTVSSCRRCEHGLMEFAGVDKAARSKMGVWKMQEWTYRHDMARVDIAGMDNAAPCGRG